MERVTGMSQDENIFRIIFAVIFFASLASSAYHRIKARTGEPLDRRQEGVLTFTLLRLGGLTAGVSAAAYLVNPAWPAWTHLPVPTWLRWIGAAIGLFAPALLFWALHHLGKNFTDTVAIRARATMVTSGPYRWVRHPFYLAAALLFISSFLVTANWVLGVAGTIVLVTLAIRTETEEKHLLQRFGDEYRRYAEQTGRFIPRLGHRSDPNHDGL